MVLRSVPTYTKLTGWLTLLGTKRLLREIETSTLRTTGGKPSRDRPRNNDIRQQGRIEDVVTFVRRQKRKWTDPWWQGKRRWINKNSARF